MVKYLLPIVDFLGYEKKDGKIVIVEEEAKVVRINLSDVFS